MSSPVNRDDQYEGRSCDLCKKGKRKCIGGLPCERCGRLKKSCVYSSSRPGKRKRETPVETNAASVSTDVYTPSQALQLIEKIEQQRQHKKQTVFGDFEITPQFQDIVESLFRPGSYSSDSVPSPLQDGLPSDTLSFHSPQSTLLEPFAYVPEIATFEKSIWGCVNFSIPSDLPHTLIDFKVASELPGTLEIHPRLFETWLDFWFTIHCPPSFQEVLVDRSFVTPPWAGVENQFVCLCICMVSARHLRQLDMMRRLLAQAKHCVGLHFDKVSIHMALGLCMLAGFHEGEQTEYYSRLAFAQCATLVEREYKTREERLHVERCVTFLQFALVMIGISAKRCLGKSSDRHIKALEDTLEDLQSREVMQIPRLMLASGESAQKMNLDPNDILLTVINGMARCRTIIYKTARSQGLQLPRDIAKLTFDPDTQESVMRNLLRTEEIIRDLTGTFHLSPEQRVLFESFLPIMKGVVLSAGNRIPEALQNFRTGINSVLSWDVVPSLHPSILDICISCYIRVTQLGDRRLQLDAWTMYDRVRRNTTKPDGKVPELEADPPNIDLRELVDLV